MGWHSEDWKGIAATIGKIAPALGTIIGGPVGGAAGTAISVLTSSLGLSSDATPEDVQKAIETDPDAYKKIKQAELDHELELQKLVYQTIQAGYKYDAAIIASLNKADSSGHSTRPKIALELSRAFLVVYCLIGAAMTYAIVTGGMQLNDAWVALTAFLGIPMAVIKMYFGDLRTEKAIDKGVAPVSLLGGLLGRKK